MNENIVTCAWDAFNKGDYTEAKALYQKAATQYGESLFRFNIKLCEKRARQHSFYMLERKREDE